MDIDAMWGQFVKWRPMLDELFEQWSQMKEQNLAEQRRTIDGRVLSEEEIAANDSGQSGGRALPGTLPTAGAHPIAPVGEPLEIGSEEELDRLREMYAEKESMAVEDVDGRWHAHRLREELDLEADVPILSKVEASAPEASAGQPGAPGTGATASGIGGQNNDPNAGAATASGTGGQNNPPQIGAATASGTGGQNNPPQVDDNTRPEPGTQGQVLEQQTGTSRGQERGATQGGASSHIQDGSSVRGREATTHLQRGDVKKEEKSTPRRGR